MHSLDKITFIEQQALKYYLKTLPVSIKKNITTESVDNTVIQFDTTLGSFIEHFRQLNLMKHEQYNDHSTYKVDY